MDATESVFTPFGALWTEFAEFRSSRNEWLNESAYVWDVWGTLVEPITSRIPYMVTVGNHEYDHDGLHPEPSGAPPGGWHPKGTSPVPWGNLAL